MRKKGIFLLILLQTCLSIHSQEFSYQAGLHSFFDNNEFDGCPLGFSQTMAGVHAIPQIGLDWNLKHRIFVGIDAMHEFGSNKIFGFYDPIAYYNYNGNTSRFYAGAFPRKLVLEKYPKFFFQDSILNYRPVINGFFFEINSKKGNYLNAWLDWISRQTYTQREIFLMGWSGRYGGDLLYFQHFGYMFHFAGSLDLEHRLPIHDNSRMWTALGLDFSSLTSFNALDFNAGWAMGIERNRADNEGWRYSQGLLSQVNIEYRWFGILNTFYLGKGQGKFYDKYNNQLYWDDKLYRAKQYNRLDGCLNFLRNEVVTLKFIFSFHFIEPGVFTSQQFYATFDLDYSKNKKTGRR